MTFGCQRPEVEKKMLFKMHLCYKYPSKTLSEMNMLTLQIKLTRSNHPPKCRETKNTIRNILVYISVVL